MNYFSKIFKLLDKTERLTGFKVSLTVFINALLDFASVAALLPLLYSMLNKGENLRVAILFAIISVSICIVKYFLSTRFALFQQRYLLGLYKRLSYSLYSSYFRKGLLYIRKNGFSKLGYEVNVLCYSFSEGMLASILSMLADGLLIVLIMLGLTIYSPLSSLIIVGCFIPCVIVYLLLIRKKAKYYGDKMMKARRRQMRIVNDTFAGYAELEVNNSFQLYSKQFLDGIDEIKDSRLKMVTINRLPGLLTELAIIVGLVVLATGILGDVTIMLGIFTVAAFKVLPALKAILSSWTTFQNNSFCLDVIEEGLKEDTNITNPQIISFNNAIVFDNLTYNYPDSDIVLNNINFTIKKGEYIGLKGYSGAGKSTLFNLLLGFIQATEGEILIDNQKLTLQNRSSWLSKIGYVPQDVFIFRGSLLENITMACTNPNKDKVLKLIKDLSLQDWFNTLPEGLDTDLHELGSRVSGGQKQRIGIARALYKDIELLLLDEATSALDNNTEKDINLILNTLRTDYKTLTIISIAHRESSIAYCDRVIDID